MSELTVFTARKIRTMNPSFPTATAVAVRDGRIVEVGTLETMRPWLDAHPHKIDTRFENHVLMPGFIDPHLHPSLGALLLPGEFITAFPWKLPGRNCEAVVGHEDYLARLAELEAEMEDPDAPLFAWGHHKIWHGDINRTVLNGISTTRPVIAWQRSYHEIVVNDAALDWIGIPREEMERHPQIDVELGRFCESGLEVAGQAMKSFLAEPTRFEGGLRQLREVVHHGGHTTIGELAYPQLDHEGEWAMLNKVMENEDTPFRMQIVPRANFTGAWEGSVEADLARLEGFQKLSKHRLFFGNGVKIFTDGGYFSEMMQMGDPGFIDGHHGEWLMAPEVFEMMARAYWTAGKRIHVHCTGDLGVELAIDTLAKLQAEYPRFDHRFTIEHFGSSTPEQVRRMEKLGACVSANVYFVHELGEAYWKHSIGYERASQMVRLGSLERAGIPTALHTDFTMAPAQPLNSAWVAVNRIAESGAVLGPQERMSLDAAMRAITIDAAYVLGMENEVGSIRAGKKADFAVLEADPWEVKPEELREIPIWGTVFEGTPYPIEV